MLAVRPGDHIAATFAAADVFASTTVEFAEQAVAAGGQVLVFPGDPYRDDPRPFRDDIGRRSPMLAAATAAGQVSVADSRRVQLAPGRFAPDHLHRTYAAATGAAVAAGYRGLWVSVDMAWASDVDPVASAAFEAMAFPLFTSGELTALCHYDTRLFSAGVVEAACQAHPAGLELGEPLRHRRLHDGSTLQLSGDSDIDNRLAFSAVLGSLRPGDTLDITAMGFVDVHGLDLIVQQHLRVPGLTVRATRRQAHLLDLVRTGRDHSPRAAAA
jgi:hypothetical protein